MSNLKIDNYQQHFSFPDLEEEVLKHWEETDAFERSVEERPEDNPYVFYDGPPFATGLPHYGHILASTIKDVMPRYYTMKGHRVERVWGWDCHGLPIENIIEEELDLKGGKKGIEEYGIDKFNAACRSAIFRFDKEWEKVINRIGRWVDFKNSYKTMDTTFMESVWWAFKELFDKGLVYEGRRVIHYCPRCSTPLSNFEIAMDNSYKDVEDYSVFIKFPVKGKDNEYLLAWTTTPWTLLGNVGLAVKPDANYLKVEQNGEILYLAEDRQEILEEGYEVLGELTGTELEGFEYTPLYEYLDIKDKKAYYVSTADFVTLDEGTGIVHTAAMYGEDDYELAKKMDLPTVDMLDEQGHFMDFVKPLAGKFYKGSENWVVDDLKQRNLMYKVERLTHAYPHCYRCDTPLYYNAVPAWFIDVQQMKEDLIQQNENINWYPEHLKHGRFGKGLETAPDWNISRSRYWGTPMPIWIGESGRKRVIGSMEELKEWAVRPEEVEGLHDLHREYVDQIEVWVDDEKTEKGTRIPEVFDCWVESGSMPYASEHYPFENKEKFEKRHPAQFIAEYIAQTRAWFYTLHVMSVGLFGSHTFENAVTTGTILAEDGQKMSKSKKNFPDPMGLINQYGVDSLRLYLMSSTVMRAQNLNFSEREVDEIRKKVLNIFFNVFKFYKLYEGGGEDYGFPKNLEDVMDKWLVSITERLTQEFAQAMDEYDVVTASRKLMEYVDELSTWYVRRSRDRLRDGNQESLKVLRTAIKRWVLLAAPFAPFITEVIYQNLPGEKLDSIHLELLPKADTALIEKELEEDMQLIRQVVQDAHAQRKQAQLKLRQPLAQVTVTASQDKPEEELLNVLADEINVKAVEWQDGGEFTVELNTVLTPELKAEGEAREIIRDIQKERRKLGTAFDEKILVELPEWPKEFEDEIKQTVLATELKEGPELKISRNSGQA